jgi:hypothetical protein
MKLIQFALATFCMVKLVLSHQILPREDGHDLHDGHDDDEHSSLITSDAVVAWASCGEPDDLFTIQTVSVSPNPVKVGQAITFNIAGQLNGQILQGSELETKIYSGGLKAHEMKLDFCDFVMKQGGSCPINPGPQNVSWTYPMPYNTTKVSPQFPLSSCPFVSML